MRTILASRTGQRCSIVFTQQQSGQILLDLRLKHFQDLDKFDSISISTQSCLTCNMGSGVIDFNETSCIIITSSPQCSGSTWPAQRSTSTLRSGRWWFVTKTREKQVKDDLSQKNDRKQVNYDLSQKNKKKTGKLWFVTKKEKNRQMMICHKKREKNR